MTASDSVSSEPGHSLTAESVRALAADNAAAAHQLRTSAIPQHVGMAAACRGLAAELPRAMVAAVEAELASGDLAQRWSAARDAAMAEGAESDDATMRAVAVVLREQSRIAMRHLVARAKDWTSDAYRLEGQASALEAQAERLRRLGETSSTPAAVRDVEADETGG